MVTLLHKTLGECGGRGRKVSIKDTDYPKLHLPQEAKQRGQKVLSQLLWVSASHLQMDLGLLWDIGGYQPSGGMMDEYSDQKSPPLHTGTATTSQWSWEQHQDIAVFGGLCEAVKNAL